MAAEVCARERCVYNLDGGNVSYFLVSPNVCIRQMLRGRQSSLTPSAYHAAKCLLFGREEYERAEVRGEVRWKVTGKRREREVDRGRDGFDVTHILPLIFDSNLMYDVSPAVAFVLWGKNAYMF